MLLMTHTLLFGDHGKQVTLLAIVHNDIDAVGLLDQTVHVDNGRVTCATMERDFAHPEAALSLVDIIATQLLDSALDGATIAVVQCVEDDTIGAVTDYRMSCT